MDSPLSHFGGESEIRTREPLLTVTRFPGVPLQPLEHLSLKKRCKFTANLLDCSNCHRYFLILYYFFAYIHLVVDQ